MRLWLTVITTATIWAQSALGQESRISKSLESELGPARSDEAVHFWTGIAAGAVVGMILGVLLGAFLYRRGWVLLGRAGDTDVLKPANIPLIPVSVCAAVGAASAYFILRRLGVSP